MKRVTFAPLLVITAAAVSACSPPHFLRIELNSSWSSDHGWQVYLRRTDGQEEYVSDTTIDPKFLVDSTLRIQLDKAQGDLLVSFATLGMGKCKTRYHAKTIPIDAANPETTLPLPYIMNDNVPWPSRCNCHMGWCKIKSDESLASYQSIAGFRDSEKNNPFSPYPVWVLAQRQSGLFEIENPDQSDETKIVKSPNQHENIKYLSFVNANDSGVNYLLALSDNQLHRKKTNSTSEYLQPLTEWNSTLSAWKPNFKKIIARRTAGTSAANEKIYIAGSVDDEAYAAILHYNGTNWDNVLGGDSKSPKNSYPSIYINSAWIGSKLDELIVAVGKTGTIIHRTGGRENTISIDEEDKTTAELRTVTCIDNQDAPCWAAGANGVIYQIDGLRVSRIRANKLNLATTNHVDQEALLVNGSLSMHLQEKGKSVAWFVGSHGTVLFYNDSKWHWHQVLEKDEDANTVTYHDIWGTDEQNVWIVGNGSRVRIIDPTIPL